MLLAADVGGTKTLIGLYRVGGDRPSPVATRSYPTLDFGGLEPLVRTFLDDHRGQTIDAVAMGVAGPAINLVAHLTARPSWVADLGRIAAMLNGAKVALLNDLEAMAYAVPVLESEELLILQDCPVPRGANAALIAAGTGLGEAQLHNINGRIMPMASEGGHADFAARSARELALVEHLSGRIGRVEVEAIVSGRGIVNIFRFAHGKDDLKAACAIIGPHVDPADLPAAISKAALSGTCRHCAETLHLFVSAYGAEAGNLALRAVALGGVYVGGGIAPKILPALEDGTFMDAFLAKAPMGELMKKIPVKVILNASSGLIGASVKASSLVRH